MKKQVRIILAGGGSGGHVTPLLAVASKLLSRPEVAEIHYIGGRNDKIARRLITAEKTRFKTIKWIESGKFRRFVGLSFSQKLILWRLYLANIRDVALVLVGIIQATVYLIFRRPDVVFSKGGYPALPVAMAATLLRIPLVTHDSDAISGLTHKLSGRFAKVRLFGVPVSDDSKNRRYVGVPVSEEFTKAAPHNKQKQLINQLGLDKSKKLILVTGGGLGSKRLNSASIKACAEISSTNMVQTIIITGSKFYQQAKQELKQQPLKLQSSVKLIEFSNQMPALISLADIVVTRAGATILAELAVARKPIVIVANPQLPGSHQIYNAKQFVSHKAALEVADLGKRVDEEQLKLKLLEIINSDELTNKLVSNITSLARTNASQAVADAIIEVAVEN